MLLYDHRDTPPWLRSRRWMAYLCNRNSKWATRRNKWTSGSNVGYFGVVMRRRRVYVDKDREMVPFRVKFTTVLAGLVAVLWCWWWWCLCGTRCEPRCVVLETFCCCVYVGSAANHNFFALITNVRRGLSNARNSILPSPVLWPMDGWIDGYIDDSTPERPAGIISSWRDCSDKIPCVWIYEHNLRNKITIPIIFWVLTRLPLSPFTSSYIVYDPCTTRWWTQRNLI